MPFQTKKFDEMPPGVHADWDPDVEIFFHGQLILRSADGLSCDVVVNPLATDHVLSIEVRIKKCDEKTNLIRMRHLGPLNFRDSEAMLMEVLGGEEEEPLVPAAFKLVTSDDPVDFSKLDGARPDDFRWILNVEGPMFHNKALNPPGFASQNVIRLRGAEYYFKTAARPNDKLQYQRSGGGLDNATFRTIGSVACAGVFLRGIESFVITWKDGTREEDRMLILERLQNTRYEIYIENTPLCLDKPRPQDLARMDEFVHYYKILDVPSDERFSVVPQLTDVGDLGSPDVPCQVVTGDGPGPG